MEEPEDLRRALSAVAPGQSRNTQTPRRGDGRAVTSYRRVRPPVEPWSILHIRHVGTAIPFCGNKSPADALTSRVRLCVPCHVRISERLTPGAAVRRPVGQR
jgi:hypothetical protein